MFKANYTGDCGFGHCYPPVLTERYYLNGQLNFTDLQTHKQVSNQITRGACNTSRSGYIPANGMVYTFPKHCLCFPMLEGNVCLAPAGGDPTPAPAGPALVHGPAWPAQAEAPTPASQPASPAVDDWPTFRHDEYRSAGTDAPAPDTPDVCWSADIPGPDYKAELEAEWLGNPYTAGPISAPVVAGGRVFVAQSDTHTMVALEEATGRMAWRFVADGRIDGPPTVHAGMCLFGCRDGWVYSVRASDGQLIWKRRIAPDDRRICVYGQLESPWPVPASVLVTDGLAYVAAGLHPNADGGIRVACLRPATGELVWQGRFDDLGFEAPLPDPHDPRKTRPDSNPWRTIRPMEYRSFDLPVRDSNSLAISRCLFDLKTGKAALCKTSGFYRVLPSGAYLPRTAWHYGEDRNFPPVAACRGASVFATVPGVSKLFRSDFAGDQPFSTDWVGVSLEQEKAGLDRATSKLLALGAKWAVPSADNKARANRAMIVASNRLFVVAPDGRLTVYDAQDGRALADRKLDLAAWDGMAAAHGKLFISTVTGKVLCLGSR